MGEVYYHCTLFKRAVGPGVVIFRPKVSTLDGGPSISVIPCHRSPVISLVTVEFHVLHRDVFEVAEAKPGRLMVGRCADENRDTLGTEWPAGIPHGYDLRTLIVPSAKSNRETSRSVVIFLVERVVVRVLGRPVSAVGGLATRSMLAVVVIAGGVT